MERLGAILARVVRPRTVFWCGSCFARQPIGDGVRCLRCAGVMRRFVDANAD